MKKWIVGPIEKIASISPVFATAAYGTAVFFGMLNYSALTASLSVENAILGAAASLAPLALNPLMGKNKKIKNTLFAGAIGALSPFAVVPVVAYQTFQTSRLLARRAQAEKNAKPKASKPLPSVPTL